MRWRWRRRAGLEHRVESDRWWEHLQFRWDDKRLWRDDDRRRLVRWRHDRVVRRHDDHSTGYDAPGHNAAGDHAVRHAGVWGRQPANDHTAGYDATAGHHTARAELRVVGPRIE
jgi:hypothetical protein